MMGGYMNLVVSFVNGREKYFKVDDYCFDEEMGYLELIRCEKTAGMISLNQIICWYVED